MTVVGVRGTGCGWFIADRPLDRFAAEEVGKRGEDVVDHHVLGDVARLDVDVGLGVDRVPLLEQPVDDRLGIGGLEQRPVGAPPHPRQHEVAVGLQPDRDADARIAARVSALMKAPPPVASTFGPPSSRRRITRRSPSRK